MAGIFGGRFAAVTAKEGYGPFDDIVEAQKDQDQASGIVSDDAGQQSDQPMAQAYGQAGAKKGDEAYDKILPELNAGSADAVADAD